MINTVAYFVDGVLMVNQRVDKVYQFFRRLFVTIVTERDVGDRRFFPAQRVKHMRAKNHAAAANVIQRVARKVEPVTFGNNAAKVNLC